MGCGPVISDNRRTDYDVRMAQGLQRDDPAALIELVAVARPLVHQVATSILHDSMLADDVVQETVIDLWQSPTLYDPERGGLRRFLWIMGRSKSLRLAQRQSRFRSSPIEQLREFPELHREDDVVRLLDLYADLAKLTHCQREAIFLAYFEGRSYREVASILRLPEGTAKNRLRDGLNSLRRLSSETNLRSDDHSRSNGMGQGLRSTSFT